MVSTPDFKATSIHQLSETSIPFAYLSNTVTNLCMPLFASFGDHVRLHDLPAQLNAFLLSETIGGFSWFSLSMLEIWKSATPMDAVLYWWNHQNHEWYSTYRFRRHGGKSWSLISRARNWLNLLIFSLFCSILYCYAFVQYCEVKTIQYIAMHKFVGVLDNPHPLHL